MTKKKRIKYLVYLFETDRNMLVLKTGDATYSFTCFEMLELYL